ncbi:MAG: ATP-binding protein [Elusimicrobiales bacterium]|nr:ATP-binding protein [Elusimicrobiales bacterium]
MKKIKRIVFTGGPSAGKTSIIEIIQRRYPKEIISVPEAASILYSGGFPRIKGDDAMRHTQRAIYFTILELEDMYSKIYPDKIQICDRGTLDGIAYWPKDSEMGFTESVGTTTEKEYERYDILIHLKSPSDEEFYKLNGTRNENHRLALELDKKTLKAWEGHPNRFVIDDEKDFLVKVEKAVSIVENELLKIKD